MQPPQLQKHAIKKGEHRIGRKKGTPNKLTVTLRSVFEQTFLALQQHRLRRDKNGALLPADGKKKPIALYDWAMENPGEFYKLSARLIPQEMSGPGGGPIPLGVTGSVTVYVPDNGRAVVKKGNGKGGNGHG